MSSVEALGVWVFELHVFSGVVQGRGVQEDAECATEAGRGEDVEEEPIHHHGDVLPVSLLLCGEYRWCLQ